MLEMIYRLGLIAMDWNAFSSALKCARVGEGETLRLHPSLCTTPSPPLQQPPPLPLPRPPLLLLLVSRLPFTTLLIHTVGTEQSIEKASIAQMAHFTYVEYLYTESQLR